MTRVPGIAPEVQPALYHLPATARAMDIADIRALPGWQHDAALRAKIRDGREDEIRACIGCNICRAANSEGVGLRCTQNPTMGEEWRRGWRPERNALYPKRETALILGGDPAGLEAALTSGRRGLEVAPAETGEQFGGRRLREATLAGLATWMRVRDWRLTMLDKLPNVQLVPGSRMGAAEVAEFGADPVVLATGSRWRCDGVDVHAIRPGTFPEALTPDDVFAGAAVVGPAMIYDDEHYFMGGAPAEGLAVQGHVVRYVTTRAVASSWRVMTNEQDFLQARLIEAGVEIVPLKALKSQGKGEVALSCVYAGTEETLPCGTLVLCTGWPPDSALHDALATQGTQASRIGDFLTPSSIADAVHSAHRHARLLGQPDLPPRRERAPERSL